MQQQSRGVLRKDQKCALLYEVKTTKAKMVRTELKHNLNWGKLKARPEAIRTWDEEQRRHGNSADSEVGSKPGFSWL